MSGPSPVHDHFKTLRKPPGTGVPRRYCKYCSDSYAQGSSTSTLSLHLEKRHGLKLSSEQSRQRRSPPPSCDQADDQAADVTIMPAKKKQMTIKDSYKASCNNQLHSTFARMFAIHSLPHQLIDSPVFREALDVYRHSDINLFDRRGLGKKQAVETENLRVDVIHQLKKFSRACPITIAVDGWTNTRHDKVTNIVCLCGGTAYYWSSIVNSTAANTAEWLSQPIIDAMNDIKAEGIAISAIVADNESVNAKLVRLLLPHFPFLIHSPCAAHTIQLCVRSSLCLPGVQEVMTAMETLLEEFAKNKGHRLHLKRLQEARNSVEDNYDGDVPVSSRTVALQLIKPNATRWSSHLTCACRLIQLQQWIQQVVPQSPSFWVSLSSLIDYLKPFQAATDIVQCDTSNLFTVYQQFVALLTHVKELPDDSIVYSVKAKVKEVLLLQWKKHVNVDAVIACARVSFDTSIESHFLPAELQSSQKWFISFAVEYAYYYNLSVNSDKVTLRKEVVQQWSEFLSRKPGSAFADMDDYIDDIRNKQTEANKSSSTHRASEYSFWDPRDVWYIPQKNGALILASAAIAVLSVSASEAAVERTFSAQDATHTAKRNRLLDSSVANEMFVKFNTQAINKIRAEELDKTRNKPKTFTQTYYIAISDDFVGDFSNEEGSVASLFQSLVPVVVESKEIEEQQSPAVGGSGNNEVHAETNPRQEQQSARPAVEIRIKKAASPVGIEKFIAEYLQTHTITSNYVWAADRRNELENAAKLNNPPIKMLTDDLKKEIMKVVKGTNAGNNE